MLTLLRPFEVRHCVLLQHFESAQVSNVTITYPYVYLVYVSGVRSAKITAFAHWRRYTDWERKNNETYVFSVAKDASLAGDDVSRNVARLSRVQPFACNGWYTPIGVYYDTS